MKIGLIANIGYINRDWLVIWVETDFVCDNLLVGLRNNQGKFDSGIESWIVRINFDGQSDLIKFIRLS